MKELEIDYLPVWRKYRDLFMKCRLTKEQKGDLLDAMMDYQFEGIEPPEFDGVLLGVWSVIQQDLDFARKRYETSVENGRKGGRKKKKPAETQNNLEEGNTISESITESISNSKSNTDIEEPASADVSVCKKTYGEYGWIRLTDQEYSLLEQEMGREQLQRCIAYIDESAESTGNRNHWLNWYTVLRRCYQKRWHEASHTHVKQEIPKGASGHLGEAELEAIRWVLST